MSQSQMDKQIALEAESVALGQARYQAEQPLPWAGEAGGRKEEAALAPGKKLLTDAVQPVADAIVDFMEQASAGKAGRKHTALKYLAQIDPAQAAYLALRAAINGASEQRPLQAVALNVARSIADHLELKALAKTDPGLYRRVMDQVAKATTAKHRTGVLRHVQEKYGKLHLEWSNKECVLLGTKLLEIVEDVTSLIEQRMDSEGSNNTPIRLAFPEQAAAWLEEQHARCSLLHPIHLPMVVAPKAWTNPYVGGYHTGIIKARLVKSRSRGYLDELGSVEMPQVYSAVNAIQATPWRINGRVLDVMLQLQEMGGNCAGLPRRDDMPLPPRPSGVPSDVKPENLSIDQQEDLKAWKASAAKVHAANASNRSARVAMAQKLWIANRFKDEAEIYFPHYLDFRGRVYPFASYVNPQSDDTGKALLEFAQGKALGETGGYWLAVHLANLWGVDKVALDDRVQWVQENEERILACAIDPLADNAFWLEADKPFCALAAAFEWAGFKLVGDSYVSRLPVAMDGSCSGLQHFSAMLRDEVGGAAVNLVPADKPADIYTKVSNRAQVLSDASGDAMAAVWEGKLCRKVAKQPTMTMCYSATVFGMKGQIESAVRKLGEEAGVPYLGAADPHQAATYMSKIVWEAIGDTVVAARRAMDWLKEASKVAASAGMPVRWTTPCGLPVLQEYREVLGERIEVHVGGQRIRLMVVKDGDKLSARRQASGIAPNFVHSLDSAHLMSTVNLGLANGLYDFAVIHDSFAVHACDTGLLNAVIREAFVQQYTPDVLARFRDELAEQLAVTAPDLVEQLPALPAHGSLDIEAVRESDFFFA